MPSYCLILGGLSSPDHPFRSPVLITRSDHRPRSMRPGSPARIGKIIGIGARPDAAGVRFGHIIGDVMRLGIGDRRLAVGKIHAHLPLGVGRALPPHQRVRMHRGAAGIFQHPLIATADRFLASGLHRCLAWSVDFCPCHKPPPAAKGGCFNPRICPHNSRCALGRVN